MRKGNHLANDLRNVFSQNDLHCSFSLATVNRAAYCIGLNCVLVSPDHKDLKASGLEGHVSPAANTKPGTEP